LRKNPSIQLSESGKPSLPEGGLQQILPMSEWFPACLARALALFLGADDRRLLADNHPQRRHLFVE